MFQVSALFICLLGKADMVINWQITKVERGLNLSGSPPGDSRLGEQFPSFHVSVLHIFLTTQYSFYLARLTWTLRLIIGTYTYEHPLSFPEKPNPRVFSPPNPALFQPIAQTDCKPSTKVFMNNIAIFGTNPEPV